MMDRGSFKNAPYNITNKDRMKQLREAERMMEPRKESPYSEEDRAEMDRMFQEQEPIKKAKGGMVKKAKGGMVKKVRGYAEGGSVNKMRSESTENAKSGRKALQAAIDEETAKTDFERAHYMAGLTGEEQFKGDSRVNAALFRRAIRERAAADQEALRKGKETGYSRFDGQVGSRNGDEERLANSPIGVEDGRLKYAKGGLVKKGKGGMIQVRGQGKARSKPCKCC